MSPECSQPPARVSSVASGLLHHVGAAYPDLSGFSGRYVVALVIDYPHVGVKKGLAGRPGLAQRVGRSQQAGRPAGLGHAVDLLDFYIQFGAALYKIDGHGSGAAHAPAQTAAVVLVEVGHLQHEIEHRRHQQHIINLFFFQGLPGSHRVERAHYHARATLVDIDKHRRERADVEQRQGNHVTVGVTHVCGSRDREAAPHRRGVGVHGPLGQTRGTRRIHYVQLVIVAGPGLGHSRVGLLLQLVV